MPWTGDDVPPSDEVVERWLAKRNVREVDPSEFTGRMWTGGDGSMIAVLRELKDGSLYLDQINLTEPEGNNDGDK